jgi:RNA 3'-terminal phosphate cyclase (ATP)
MTRRLEVDVTPSPLSPIDCLDRGEPASVNAQTVFTGLPFEIAERMLTRAKRDLADWPDDAFAVRELPPIRGRA